MGDETNGEVVMTDRCDDSRAFTDHDERRREFLELCGRLGMAVPPTVILLAASRNALASTGRGGPPPHAGPPSSIPPHAGPPSSVPANRR